jgi:putative nucleotidyltransferase with HDIG domain
MTSKILQIVNSAYFGLYKTVNSVNHAVILLGLERVKNLVLSVEIFSMFEPKELSGSVIAGLWRHSMFCSSLAHRIAERERLGRDMVNESSTSAFLHDIGKLIMARESPRLYRESITLAEEEVIPLFQAEKRVFGFDHAQAGGLLLTEWRLPDSIVEAVAFHHIPSQIEDATLRPLPIVHVTNYLEHRRMNEAVDPTIVELDLDYIRAVNIDSKLEDWQELVTTQSSY